MESKNDDYNILVIGKHYAFIIPWDIINEENSQCKL